MTIERMEKKIGRDDYRTDGHMAVILSQKAFSFRRTRKIGLPVG